MEPPTEKSEVIEAEEDSPPDNIMSLPREILIMILGFLTLDIQTVRLISREWRIMCDINLKYKEALQNVRRVSFPYSWPGNVTRLKMAKVRTYVMRMEGNKRIIMVNPTHPQNQNIQRSVQHPRRSTPTPVSGICILSQVMHLVTSITPSTGPTKWQPIFNFVPVLLEYENGTKLGFMPAHNNKPVFMPHEKTSFWSEFNSQGNISFDTLFVEIDENSPLFQVRLQIPNGSVLEMKEDGNIVTLDQWYDMFAPLIEVNRG